MSYMASSTFDWASRAGLAHVSPVIPSAPVSDMADTPLSNTTQCLQALSQGDDAAAAQLMPLVYDELRQIAEKHLRHERPNHTLQPTALVHEAYLKLIDQTQVQWQGRNHFLAVCAQAMRRILVDHARGKARDKRSAGGQRIELNEELMISSERSEDLLALDAALEKLAVMDARHVAIVEMRFFGGMTEEQIAEHLQISDRTVRREWTMIRAWLRRELSEEPTS